MRKLPAQGARIPATIGRTGIQIYKDENGKDIREYRPPDEVFSDASLDSLRAAPVTRMHPSEFVDGRNWQALALGSVSDVAPDRLTIDKFEFIRTDLLVFREDALEEIASKALVELSAGYTATLDHTPGITPQGEPYDRVQRSIRYNHVALLPVGHARAGSEARLRLDGHQAIIETNLSDTIKDTMLKVILDGISYEAGSESHLEAVKKHVDSATSRAEALSAANADLKSKLDAATQENAKLEGERDQLKQTLDAAPALESLVAAELTFRSDMIKILGADFDFAGKAHKDVKLAALEKLGAKIDASKEELWIDAYLQSRLDAPVVHETYKAHEKKADEAPQSVTEIADTAFKKSWASHEGTK